ncbi:MAG: LysM peptidoglycan-binding domain-containing protein [Deltaproteobacteria bacterium]|nr:LysM peptidoglycan-binding domain-containing protein [Deltaproteobacteria bacterium]
MHTSSLPYVSLLTLSLFAGSAAAAEDGKATLPAATWEAMLQELETASRAARPPVTVLSIDRRVEGVLRKGLFSATLTAIFEVPNVDSGHVRVPVLDAAAAVEEVRLNGQRTSLLKEGRLYTVGVERPGRNTLSVRFLWGKEQDRFARRLRFELPEGGPTHLRVLVPEVDIEARLGAGVLVGQERLAAGTVLEGQTDASGRVDLTWNRRLSHKSRSAAKMEARLNVLFAAEETLMAGVLALDLRLQEGEVDRVDLQLPGQVEVTAVDGDAVLQWYTEAKDGGRLAILLRYLVETEIHLRVRFQFPLEVDKPTPLSLPLPLIGTAMSGAVGIQGPAGLSIEASVVKDAEAVEVVDLPRALIDLTTSPILQGFAFSAPPALAVRIARLQTVELLSTLIDEVQASTVLIEDGAELTKIKLRLRNNTRQYLRVLFPKGAVLTHSLIDGHPVRPAVATDSPDAEALLLPLRQSERLGAAGEHTHVVAEGETLSGIANFYYSDPNGWQAILDRNTAEISSAMDLQPGAALRIPAKKGTVQESSFVVELAYKRRHPALGGVGRATLELPALDVDSMQAVWHLYLPHAIDPIAFSGNLTQYSAIRYDPFRRVRDFLRRALWVRDAWAGGRYQSILVQRKGIYQAEAGLKEEGRMVLSSFPLVGDRYRFRRVALSRETPHLTLTYVDRDLAPIFRWGAFVVAFGTALLLLLRPERRRYWPAAVAALGVLLFLAYYFLGMHRRILWGVDLAFLVVVLRAQVPLAVGRGRQLFESPWRVVDVLTLSNLGVLVVTLVYLSLALILPLLLSTLTLALIGVVWWRRQGRTEVGHE